MRGSVSGGVADALGVVVLGVAGADGLAEAVVSAAPTSAGARLHAAARTATPTTIPNSADGRFVGSNNDVLT